MNYSNRSTPRHRHPLFRFSRWPALLLVLTGVIAGIFCQTTNFNLPGSASIVNAITPAPDPTLGNYPNTYVATSGDTLATPDAAPANATSISVSTDTNFKGTFAAKPGTGAVRITDAHPAGTYTVTVRAFDGVGGTVTKSFRLVVQATVACLVEPAFTNASDVTVGVTPSSVAIGDFNNDGKQDLAIANYGSNTVSIRLGDGAGGFSGSTNVPVSTQPGSVAIGDFNNDGKQDLAAANLGAANVSIRLGDGAGGFSGSTNISVGNGPSSVAIGDFNGDGKQDLAAANGFSNNVSIRFGDGAGGFTGSTEITVGSNPQSVAIGDFNQDGNQDLAIANGSSNNVSVRLGDGAGGFSGSTNVPVSAQPVSVAIGDFNNDGKQDLATANFGSNNVSINLGDGAGGFSGSTNISVGSTPASVAIADFNNDGKQDFAAANANSHNVSIRLGNGVGGFSGSTEINLGDSPFSVAIGDFNGDGKQDFGTANDSSASVRLNTVCSSPLTLGNYPDTSAGLSSDIVVTPDALPVGATGINISTDTNFKGSFASKLATGALRATDAHPAGAYTVTVKAFNGAVSISKTFQLTVQQGTACTGVATFANASDVSVDANPGSVAIGDFNNDGQQDLAVANNGSNTVSIRLGDGAGGFGGSTSVNVGDQPRSLAIGDFNNDGKQDLAVTNGASNVSIRLGDGAGGFSGSTEISVGSVSGSIAIGDFNSDGKQDFAVANVLDNNVSIKLGDGLGGFSGSTNVNVGTHPSSVKIGDFNNDGKQDLAVANNDSNTVSIRLGNGAGGFSGSTNVNVGTNPSSIVIGDFNNDGKQDFAAGVSPNNVSIRLGDGLGGFSGSTEITVGNLPISVAIGDFNTDGRQDLAVANLSSNNVSIRLGDGLGGFSGSTEINAGTNPSSVAIGDFNNDGRQDLTTTNNGGGNVSIRLGGCNAAPTISAATGKIRQQGSPAANSVIATVTDDGGNGLVTIQVNGSDTATVNGMTVSNIVNTNGTVTADIVAACTASNASFTLQARDGSTTVTATLDVSVAPNTGPNLSYANPPAVSFGGSANVTPTTASDNGSITGYSIQSVTPALTTAPTVNSSGSVSITNAKPPGNHTITIRATDNCGSTTDASFTLTVNKNDQTITFGALANKMFGDADFNVNPTASSGLSVSLAASGNCTVSSPSPGTVHLTGAGSCMITASQTGDATFNAAADQSQSFTIAKAGTTTTVASAVNPSDFGQSVTFTATVSSGAGTPGGTVQFKDNGVNLGSQINLNASGVAQLTTSSLSSGNHAITADYTGAPNFQSSSGALSGGQLVRDQPGISISDVTSAEGQSGTTAMTFTVKLSAASNLTVTVNFATANGTATAGSDYLGTSGALTFNPGDVSKTIPVTVNGDVSFEPDETFTVNLSGPTNATLINAAGTGTIQNDDALGGFFSFSPAIYSVNEANGLVTVTVVRTNDVTRAATVDFATDDTGASTNCAALNTGLAAQRCDYTSMFGTLKFAANETQKTIDIPVNLDAYTEGPENFTVSLSNPTAGAVFISPSTATVTINDSASPTPNAIDDTSNFVRQQYHDFLNRDADAAGLAFWKNNIDQCNDPARRQPGQTLADCLETQRIITSAAFFLSIEFRQTGGLVRDFYVATLNRPSTNNMPAFVEFMRDTQTIGKGVVVNQGNWQQILDANRLAFMNEFVMRPEFVGLYPTTDTPTQYVDKIYQHAALAPTTADRAAVIAEFGSAVTAADPAARARALLRITQDPAFQARELSRSFVHMQYLGYLRRNPNDLPDHDFAGYNFWLTKLNEFNGDFLQAEMVKAFLRSGEYRARFGP